MNAKHTLLGLSPSQQAEIPYEDLLTLRRAAYAEHVQAMPVPPALAQWAAEMASTYGRRIKVWHNTYTSWLVALLVVRYGEALEAWPEQFSEADLARALAWQRGRVPAGVSLPPPDPGPTLMGSALVLAVGLLGWWLDVLDLSTLLLSLPIFATNMTDYFEVQARTHLFRTGLTTLNAWAASTTYAVGDIVRPTTWNHRLFQCVVAGTSGATEPTWDTTIGNEQTDNTVTWQTIAVGLPKRPLFVGLFTAAPGETGGGTEVSGGSYARVANHPADANWSAPDATGGLTDNVSDLTYPTPTANWGTISHFAIFNRLNGGDMLIYGALTQPKTVNNGDPAPKFPAGALDLTWA